MTIAIPIFLIPLLLSVAAIVYFYATAERGGYFPDISAILGGIFIVLIIWLIYFIIF